MFKLFIALAVLLSAGMIMYFFNFESKCKAAGGVTTQDNPGIHCLTRDSVIEIR